MSEVLAAGRPDFFGKDSFTPFIGIVEDVNDPLHSGRVKVRCVGWHPKNNKEGDDSLKTDDLPWARVGMPTTHSQGTRMGGKHGLLPGSWVMGFFLDGDEAQDPFVLCSFNMTSKTSDRDNRKQVEAKDGKLGEEYEGFDKVMQSPDTAKGNFSLHTTQEQGQPGFSDSNDPAGDNVNNDSDSDCGGKQSLMSAASDESMNKDFKTTTTPTGLKANVQIADGKCGTNQNGAEDVNIKMQEKMPAQIERFNYGDIVWQRYQGNFMNLQGIIASISLDICQLLKAIIEAMKAEKEDRINRTTMSAGIAAVPDRDGDLRVEVKETQRQKDDIFHTIIAQIIDRLCSIIANELQQRNNEGDNDDETNNDNRGGGGANPITSINNPGAKCLTDQIIANVLNEVEVSMNEAIEEASRRVDEGEQGSSSSNSISSILGAISMLFSLTEKYTENTEVHNTQGNQSQDKANREGCKQERYYNTEEGAGMALGLISALSAAGGEGSTGETSGDGVVITRGSRSDNTIENRLKGYAKTKFGGIESALVQPGYDDTNCEESKIPREKGKPPKPDLGDVTIEGPCNVFPDVPYTFRVTNNGDSEITSAHFVVLKRIGSNGNFIYTQRFSEVINFNKRNKAEITFEDEYGLEEKNIYFVYALVWSERDPVRKKRFSKLKKKKIRVYPINTNLERLQCPPDEAQDPERPDTIPVVNQDPTQDVVVLPPIPDDDEEIVLPTTPGVPIIEIDTPINERPPEGTNGELTPLPLPSDDPICARNFVDGTPNVVVVMSSGTKYFFDNKLDASRAFPDIYIPGYIGSPTPVVDRDSGELVAILTNCQGWDPNRPLVPISVIPGENQNGYTSDDPNLDIFVSGFFVQNTGFQYCNPEIRLWDRDKDEYSDASVSPILKEGRIVGVDISSVGTGFKRIPRVDIFDDGTACNNRGGYGANIKPIMAVIAKTEAYADRLQVVQSIYCPSKDLANRFTLTRSTSQILSDIVRDTNLGTYVEPETIMTTELMDTTDYTAPTITSADTSSTLTPTPAVPTPTPYVATPSVPTPTPTTPTPATPTPASTPVPTPTPPTPSPTPPTPTPPSPTPYYGGGGY